MALALAAFVYYPITGNYFWADDFYSFYRIRNVPLWEYLLRPQGRHLLLTTYSIFYLFELLFGLHPEPYFWAVLFTHLVNVALLFLVICRFTDSPLLACFGAALWGTSPVLEASLGWYSVYGHVLVATVLLLLLLDLAKVADGNALSVPMALRWVVLLYGGVTSFGVGIGIALVLPAAAFVLLPRSPTRTTAVVLFVLAAAGVPFVYVFLHWLVPLQSLRGASLGIVEPVFEHWLPFVRMFLHLLGYGIVRTASGVLGPGLHYPGMLAGIIIALYLTPLAAATVFGPPRVQRTIVASALITITCYAIIAAGRAVFFELNEELKTTGRYQYVAPLMITLAGCAALSWLATRRPPSSLVKHGLLAGWIVLALWSHHRYGSAIDHHLAAREETAEVQSTVQRLIDAAPPNQNVIIPNRPFLSMGPIFVRAPAAFPGWAAMFVVLFPDNVIDGKPVFFVESARQVRAAARRGRRSATLLVGPEAVNPPLESMPTAALSP